jgi:lipopolysaccharide/colanic/teichoic acid biosynthesis glycosyltransferase
VLWGTLLVAAIVTRGLGRWIARKTTSIERCLFVGSDESYDRLRSKLPDGNGRAKLVGRMSLSPDADGLQTSAAILLGRLIDDLGVHRVIIEPNEAQPQITMDFVREAKATNVRVSLLPRILEVVGGAIEVDDVNGLTLLGLRRFGLSRSSWLLKRGFDVTFATAGLIAMSPILLVISLLIKLDSAGPVIFRQTRIGRGGEPFEMWKLRTMISGADELKPGLVERNEAVAGLFKIADDPRITRTGRWLRNASLDELPQLVNVLRGEMSLVGPRPLVSDEDGLISGLDRGRLHLTPGMTGHWQIAGSSRVPLAEMVKLDYLYVAGWSLGTDVRLLLRTIPYMLARRGL